MQEGTGQRRTVDEWEAHLGNQVRQARLTTNMSQERLAHIADVSTATIGNLETSAGPSLKTLIKVVRALGLDDWLEQLGPPIPTFDPVVELTPPGPASHTPACPPQPGGDVDCAPVDLAGVHTFSERIGTVGANPATSHLMFNNTPEWRRRGVKPSPPSTPDRSPPTTE